MVNLLKKILQLRFWMGILTLLNIFALLLSYSSPFIHPETIKIIPLFGLAYPFILFSILLLLIFWLLMRSKWVWVILTVIILGGTLHFRTFAFGKSEKLNNLTSLRVMSYNVQLFGLYTTLQNNSLETRNKIFSFLREEQPEVICFQEFYKKKKKNFITKDSIISILGTHFYHEKYAKQFGNRQSFGVALFSKYPIINRGDVTFLTEERSFNYCIYADIVKNKDTFRIYNAHLQSIRFGADDYALFNETNFTNTEKKDKFINLVKKVSRSYPIRARQARKIIEHIQNSPHPVIVCGDFNDTPMSYVYNQFNAQLTDAFRSCSFGLGSTYAGKIPIGRIDYIFHSKKITASNFKVQKEVLSDHYAISCEIQFKN